MYRSTYTITEAPPQAAVRKVALPPAVAFALVAVLAVFTWQMLTVSRNYGGSWSGLFCTGDFQPVPREPAAITFVFHSSRGYDGQFYRYIAGDPWLQKGWWRYLDAPRVRYWRILVPAAAWLLAGGRPGAIDAAYVATVLVAVGLGVYWLSRYAALLGRHAAWGLGFLLLPGTLVAVDRMVVDAAFGALAVGALYYARRDAPGRLYAVLAAAMLVRETGLLLIAAACAWELWQRRWPRAILFATAALPALAWYDFISPRLPAAHGRFGGLLPRWFFRYPLVGLPMQLFRPETYPFAVPLNRLLQVLDISALCAFLLAAGSAAWRLRRRVFGFEEWTILAFLAMALCVSTPRYWDNVYGYARAFSPLLLLAALPVLRERRMWALAPLLLVDVRIAAQWAPQATGILRGFVAP